jgi:hypothetical protein
MTRRSELPAHLAACSFTVRDARAAGISASRLRALDLALPSRGIRVPRAAEQGLARRAAPYLALASEAVISHLSALALRGLPLPEALRHDVRLHLTVPPGGVQFRRRGVAGHRAALAPEDTETVDGVPVTSPARTFLDIAALPGVTTEDLVVLGDALVSEHRRSVYGTVAVVRLPGLRAAVEAASRRRGSAKAREALALVRVGVDSPMETRLRLALARAGLPEPVVGCLIEGESGRHTYVDLGFPRFRLAVDYDGSHHLTPAQQTRDALRAQEIADAGWRLVVITKGDLRRGDAWVAARVAEVLRRQGWEDTRP